MDRRFVAAVLVLSAIVSGLWVWLGRPEASPVPTSVTVPPSATVLEPEEAHPALDEPVSEETASEIVSGATISGPQFLKSLAIRCRAS